MATIYKRAGKDGKGAWCVRYHDPVTGKDTRKATKAKTKREAEIILANIVRDIDNGKYETAQRQREVTFFEIAEDFLAYSKAHKKSWERDQRTIKILKAYFGNAPIIKILPKNIEQYIAHRKKTISHLKTNIGPATINRELACMKSIFNRAIDNELTDRNPVNKIKFFRENNKRDRVLTAEEYDRLLNAVAPHLKPMIILAYNTGMRKGEILTLTWNQVNLEDGWINLNAEQTKTSEARKIPLSYQVIECLKNIDRNGDRVIQYRGKPVGDFRQTFQKALKKAGIENFRFHDLRHTFVTNMRKANKQDRAIMKITGHKTMSVFMRYDTVDEEDLKKVVAA